MSFCSFFLLLVIEESIGLTEEELECGISEVISTVTFEGNVGREISKDP